MSDGISKRRLVTEDINIQRWLPLQSDTHQYLLKSFFNSSSTSYHVILYGDVDMGMWSEDVDCKRFVEKCGHSSEESVDISLKSTIKGNITFSWIFTCSKCDQSTVKSILVDPLFIMVKEMLRREQILFALLERKDKEIEDYVDQGTTLTRKHLKTAKFDKSAFLHSSAVNEDFFASCASPSANVLVTSGVSNLYRNVMINQQANSRTDVMAPSQSVRFDTVPSNTVNQEMPSWSSVLRNPTSIVDDKLVGSTEVRGDTVPVEPVVDAKVDEQKRREAIRLRLEENERKLRKKKKKINI